MPRIGSSACVRGSRRVERGAAGGVALDDEQFALVGVAAAAVLQLVGHAGAGERRLATDGVASVLGGEPGLRRGLRLLDQPIGLGRVLFQPFGEPLVGGLLHEGAHRHVAELGLGLALELRVAQLHRDDGGDALADVFAEQVLFLFLEQVLGACVLVDHAGERGLEALDVHATLDGGDAVGVAVDALVVAGVPLDGDVERLVVGLVFVFEVGDLARTVPLSMR